MDNDGLALVNPADALSVGAGAVTGLDFPQMGAAAFDDKQIPVVARSKQLSIREVENIFPPADHHPDIEPEVVTERRLRIDEVGHDIDAFHFNAELRHLRRECESCRT